MCVLMSDKQGWFVLMGISHKPIRPSLPCTPACLTGCGAFGGKVSLQERYAERNHVPFSPAARGELLPTPFTLRSLLPAVNPCCCFHPGAAPWGCCDCSHHQLCCWAAATEPPPMPHWPLCMEGACQPWWAPTLAATWATDWWFLFLIAFFL